MEKLSSYPQIIGDKSIFDRDLIYFLCYKAQGDLHVITSEKCRMHVYVLLTFLRDVVMLRNRDNNPLIDNAYIGILSAKATIKI